MLNAILIYASILGGISSKETATTNPVEAHRRQIRRKKLRKLKKVRDYL